MKSWHVLLAVVICWAAIYLPGLSSLELRGEEPRRVLPGMEMMQTSDWITPRIAGEDYHRKPPLVNWLAAASFSVTGTYSEWAARLPSVLSVLALALTAAAVGCRLYGLSGGLFAGVVLLTNIGMLEKGRLAEIEPLYIALFGIGWLLWFLLWREEKSPWLYWLVPSVPLGLAILAKGPVHLVFFYALVVCLLGAKKQKKALLHPAHWLGIGVQLAVALPWFLASSSNTSDGGAAAGTWMDQITSRLALDDVSWVGWPIAIVQAAVNFLPWAVPLVMLYFARFRERVGIPSREQDLVLDGLLRGLLIAFLLIVLIPTSRPRFTLPLMVPATLLLTHGVAMMADAGRESLVVWWRRVLRGLLLLVGIAAVVAPFFAVVDARLTTAVGCGVVVVGVWILWHLLAIHGEGQIDRLTLVTGSWAAMVVAFFVFAAVPHLQLREKIKPTGLAVKSLLEPDEKAVLYKGGYQPFVFYAWPQVEEWPSWDNVPSSVDQMPRVFLMEKKDWEKKSERKKFIKRFGEPVVLREIANEWGGGKPLVALGFKE
ncbi:ArnT family glycosyltransferase [Sulfuriroseicoccus oceanibius]|uniref:Glycosyltransferase family 39 protein n=1 Tax=Sulfuriroseicoccus oceanibius TaxID=2707525 RepID=A0A6B3KZZ6_9BACT|nr:glycosyltransferase family 39 protein [Sulfuriroseicoccus oceanibius]QQL46317.1 glycosyltransferase family 39 protein [Sulfuriroseicoccus oceanibius]